jgi:hypothetical protein
MEGYRKILIIAEWNSEIDIVNDFVDWSLQLRTDGAVKIDSIMTLIETLYDIDELKEEFKNLTEVKFVDVTDGNVYELLSDYPDCVSIDVINAIKKLDISDDINYFLDLITERGGESYMLTDKERQRIRDLTPR